MFYFRVPGRHLKFSSRRVCVLKHLFLCPQQCTRARSPCCCTLAEHFHLHAWFRARLSINLSSPRAAWHQDARLNFSYTSTPIICLNVFKWVLVVVPPAVCASYHYTLLTSSRWDELMRGGFTCSDITISCLLCLKGVRRSEVTLMTLLSSSIRSLLVSSSSWLLLKCVALERSSQPHCVVSLLIKAFITGHGDSFSQINWRIKRFVLHSVSRT